MRSCSARPSGTTRCQSHSGPEAFEQALDWATEVRYGASALIVPVSAHPWRPFDYLIDTIKSPIPPGLWDAATAPETHAAIGMAAYRANLSGIAEAAWKLAAQAGHGIALVSLGGLMEEQGEAARTEEWYYTAIKDQDEPSAMLNLGFLLLRRETRRKPRTGGAGPPIEATTKRCVISPSC